MHWRMYSGPPLRDLFGPADPHSNLATVKLLGRKKGHEEGAAELVELAAPDDLNALDASARGSRKTDPKGRPTPKRDEAARRGAKKGPIAPAPKTASEARARRKTLASPKLSRDERRAQRVTNRAKMTDRRERMMAGDEAYLLPRDQGPVRRYTRDIVDSRRNLLGLFMPSALFLLFVSMGVPQLQFYMSPVMFGLMAVMGVDAFILARKVNKMVDAKFPTNTESHWKIGMYAAGRASQMRRMRAPRPQVGRGGSVR
jgi:Protein of unknown function (DUF3043)